MIQLRNLEKFYDTRAGRTYVLRRINLDIKQGEFVTVMGPSGAGKSTILAILGMLDSSWQGEFFFLENAVHRMKPKQRVELNKQYIGFVFQQCRVESGRADRPFHRPLNQTARAVFPQAAFLSCSSFGIRCVAAGGGFVRTAFGSFAKGTIQFHDISAFPIARTFTTEYGDFPLQRAFWTRQRRCSKQRSETLCLPSRS